MKEGSNRHQGLLLAIEKGYTCTKEGVVYSPKGYMLKPFTRNKSRKDMPEYLAFGVGLKNSRRTQDVLIHQLQAYLKYGDKILEHDCVRHLDGNSLNNHWDNIALGSHIDNAMDKPSAVRTKVALNASSYIKKYDPVAVRQFYSTCRSYKKTMENFGISSKGTLHYVLNKSLA